MGRRPPEVAPGTPSAGSPADRVPRGRGVLLYRGPSSCDLVLAVSSIADAVAATVMRWFSHAVFVLGSGPLQRGDTALCVSVSKLQGSALRGRCAPHDAIKGDK